MTNIDTPAPTEEPKSQRRDSLVEAQKQANRKPEGWTITQKMRLPHKVGLPLGSGGGGDDGRG